ncbi:AbrB/MazE/SpoVT family DNA-binding domain-containing protein [uncultured Clostridium sp.]|uniref:AbrB/MazE/SpoVT family DNA-binding domain-containing protein n=1 Tax=uncultured Clostridium sp. TaxID=59620 RepID=UPI0025E2CF49|nr:AbrB/MazE/SpoVT family DNA-binding domain-containing protein [uncultured Clostridium sp.]
MITEGVIRNIDNLGRVVIPKEIRKKHSMNEGEPVVISDCGNYVIVKKYINGCIFCGNTKDVIEYKDICICNKCRKSLSK